MTPPPAPTASLADLAARLAGFDPTNLRVDLASRLIHDAIEPVAATELVSLASASGRVLATELLSPIDVPAYDNAAMDGYGFAAASLQAGEARRLRLVGRALAGRPWNQAVARGEAIRVTTGAPLPNGVDTVVMQEHCHVDGDWLTPPDRTVPGSHCRQRGEDLRAGHPALPAGRRLNAADVGLLASLGLAQAEVRRRIRVACLSTGDELCTAGTPLPAGRIYDSNRVALSAMLARLGAEVIDLGVIPDRRDALERALTDASDTCDAIVSSGGMSVGDADFTGPVTAALGEVLFWRLAVRPGRPFAFGRLGRALYFGLPGNPVAAMTSFVMFARPGLLRRMGAHPVAPPLLRVRSGQAFTKQRGRCELQRGVLQPGADGTPQVVSTGDQGSGILRSMSRADCLVVLHPEQANVAPGDPVDVLLLEGIV